MIKKNWKKIIMLILIITISTSVGVYATSYILNSTKVTFVKTDGSTISVKEALDGLYTKAELSQFEQFEQGQLVTYNGEEFYVLYETDTTIDLFAKTNLNSDATAQANAAHSSTSCVFSSTNSYSYWSSLVSGTSNLNLNNINGFSDTDAIGKARKYARLKGAISGRLLTYEEANSLKESYPAMIYGYGNTAQSYNGHGYEYYWLGSAYSINYVWDVNRLRRLEPRQLLRRGWRSPSYNSLQI